MANVIYINKRPIEEKRQIFIKEELQIIIGIALLFHLGDRVSPSPYEDGLDLVTKTYRVENINVSSIV